MAFVFLIMSDCLNDGWTRNGVAIPLKTADAMNPKCCLHVKSCPKGLINRALRQPVKDAVIL